jgi:hypothetical protein
MKVGLFKIALFLGLLAGGLNYYNPSLFTRVAHVDCKAWAMNALSKLHLDLFQKAINEHPIQVIVSLLRNENSRDGVQKLAGLHRAIQKLTTTPLCQEVEIERSIGDLDALDKEVMASLRGLASCQLHGEAQNKARVLEQVLLTRIHELIFWRKSCESSHQHAIKDALPENALLPVAEPTTATAATKEGTATTAIPDETATILGAGDGMPGYLNALKAAKGHARSGEVESGGDSRAQEQEKIREQIKAADTARRRQLFAQGAKQRWINNSARLKAQIQEDLKRLDVLMAAAVL